MLGNTKQNRILRTSDLFLLIVLVGVVGSIFGAIMAQALQDDRPQRAQAMAEVLARQIHAQRAQATVIASQRGPASVEGAPTILLTSGDIGRDPWGHPFHYVVHKGDGERSTKIYVWCDGPNGKADSSIAPTVGTTSIREALSADDIGYAEAFAGEI